MKLQRVNNRFVALLILLCCACPWPTQAEEAASPAAAAAAQAPCPVAAPCWREGAPDGRETTAGQDADGTGPDLQTLKQRYLHDPTGVRARLGMCRRGQDGHGPHRGGQQRRHRGAEPWDEP